MQFSAEQAQKQMDFQERMSNTSYQRAVADLEAAGLNPMLLYSNLSGSSSPSGAAGSGISSSGASASGVSASGSSASGVKSNPSSAKSADLQYILQKMSSTT